MPVKHPNQVLIDLIEAENITEFNAQRPSGQLDLIGMRLFKKSLVGANFAHCDLSGGAFISCVFKACDLTSAVLYKCDFLSSTFPDSCLRGADLSQANLHDTYMTIDQLARARNIAHSKDCNSSRLGLAIALQNQRLLAVQNDMLILLLGDNTTADSPDKKNLCSMAKAQLENLGNR